MKKRQAVFGIVRRSSGLRYYSEEKKEKEIQIHKEESIPVGSSKFLRRQLYYNPRQPVWIENSALRKKARESDFAKRPEHYRTEILRVCQGFRDFPTTPRQLFYTFRKYVEKTQVRVQEYLPQRHAILKNELAAAHFIVGRGGAIQFFGLREWVGKNHVWKALPAMYTPGLFIGKIDAEGTGLMFEGFVNLTRLKRITHLSLKGLERINDMCLDWISREYYSTLTHLNLSGCKNITYRGLSCFYRFDHLRSLNLTDIPDTPEMKLACIMLQDVMPHLEIIGINLEIPKELQPVHKDKIKELEQP